MIAVCLCALVTSLAVNHQKVRDELAAAIKQDITNEQMKEAEQVIKLFLAQKKIPYGANITEIGAALNIREGEVAEWISGQTHLSSPYVAAALLMPLDSVYTYLEENHFRTASPRMRIKITKNLCKTYGVDEIVALRRIREVYMVKEA